MRIAIDYTAALQARSDIGIYTRNLVAAVLAEDTSNQYTLLSSEAPTSRHSFPQAAHVRRRRLPQLPISLPVTLFSGAIDMYHSPDAHLPSLNKHVCKIATIHDPTFLVHPEYVAPPHIHTLNNTIPRVVESADVIITPSNATSSALINHLQAPPEKLVVVPYGVSSYARRISDPILLEATRHKFGLKDPFVLTVGTLETRHNYVTLIKAFYQAMKRKNGPAMLVIVGEYGWQHEEILHTIEERKISKKVRILTQVSDLERILLYSMAESFVAPSLCADAGVAQMEAMACGTPIITTNISAFADLVGEAALLIDLQHVDKLAQALTRLREDEQLRKDLRQKGYERVRQYTWQKSARNIIDLYQKLYHGEKDFSDKVVSV